ncbi:MAG: helix-turn-helix domain-containing protein [bacterium]
MVSINEKIKQLRISKGIKKADVARAAGIKHPTYTSIENGDTKSISIEVGKGIADVLGISFNELFGIDTPVNPDIEVLTKKIEDLEKQIQAQKELIKIQTDAIELYKQGYLQSKIIYTLNERITMIIKEELAKDKNISHSELSRKVGNKIQRELPNIEKKVKDENDF